MTIKILSLLALAAVIEISFGLDSNICRLTEPCAVTYLTLGCYKDVTSGERVLPHYIYNERDSTHSNYGNRQIDWYNWEKYIAEFSCRCAAKAKEEGYDLFGVQFYGECWAGNSANHSYARLGSSDECIGDQYKACSSTDRYCVGGEYTNFVYKIVDTSCSLDFERVGCYKDNHNNGSRPLANYVLTDRELSLSVSSGRLIDWTNYDAYLPDFACRCAKKAKDNGGTYFGLQYYGECWTHPDGDETFSRDGDSSACVDGCDKKCGGDLGEICAGEQFTNYVYRIKEAGQPDCDVTLESMGCYVEDASNRALREELQNIDPGTEKFYGRMPVVGNWNDFFPNFLCRCSQLARAKGWQYFGINDYGECYSDADSANRYNTHGASDKCREGAADSACASGSKLCSGPDKTANYVYKVVTQSDSSKRSFVPAKHPRMRDYY